MIGKLSNPARWLRPEILSLSAYAVPSAKGLIKLDAMENPYPWPAELRPALLERLAEVAINRYPDPRADDLREQLKTTMEVPASHELLLGNGSDELIQILSLAVARPGRIVMAPEPTFVMYRMIADFAQLGYQGIPLRADFNLDIEAMQNAIDAAEPALLFLAYPNNPTGNTWWREDMDYLIRHCPGLVVVDEAYAPFTKDSFLGDLTRYDNLLVLRTVSKMGLAGLRLGYLSGPKTLIDEFDKIRLPYNINSLTQATAELALSHKALFDAQAKAIRQHRDELHNALVTIDGIEPYPSQANFILFRTQPGLADVIFERLLRAGVLIKNLSRNGGLLTDCLRVTVGTKDENAAFLQALRDAVRLEAS